MNKHGLGGACVHSLDLGINWSSIVENKHPQGDPTPLFSPSEHRSLDGSHESHIWYRTCTSDTKQGTLLHQNQVLQQEDDHPFQTKTTSITSNQSTQTRASQNSEAERTNIFLYRGSQLVSTSYTAYGKRQRVHALPPRVVFTPNSTYGKRHCMHALLLRVESCPLRRVLK